MAYICIKPKGSCTTCKHYRYDKDYGGKACFAQQDEARDNNDTTKNTKKSK